LLLIESYEVVLGAGFAVLNRANLEVNMKKLVIAAAVVAATASAAFAGTPAEPIIEAPVIVEAAEGSSQGIILPLILLVLVAAAVASS
jgi:hypothetical protein